MPTVKEVNHFARWQKIAIITNSTTWRYIVMHILINFSTIAMAKDMIMNTPSKENGNIAFFVPRLPGSVIPILMGVLAL